jgi:hypothetical protein
MCVRVSSEQKQQIADAEKHIADAEKHNADLERQLALRNRTLRTPPSRHPPMDWPANRESGAGAKKIRRKVGGQPAPAQAPAR